MNNTKISLAAFALLVMAAACNQPQKNHTEDHKQPADTAVVATPTMNMAEKDSAKKIAITEADLADKKDPVCGMPAFRYMEDTAVYQNKIYAFCSKDCKDEFVKDPAAYVKVEKEKK
jgi:YHS domain-containing protein